VSLWPQLSGGEIIDLIGRLRGGISSTRRKAMIERFELDPTKKASAYSRGNRQKVALVAALASDVELLVLDEPTTGLDPLMEDVFARCVSAERARGRTIFLSSHILSEVEALCDRVSIIRAGRNVETGTLAEMRHVTDTSVDIILRDQLPDLATLPRVGALEVDGTRIRCLVPTEHLGELLAVLGPYGIRTLTCQPPSLEQLFLRLYSARAAAPAAVIAGDPQ
jgi:ABC-2 type transport system ATP-binding protein